MKWPWVSRAFLDGVVNAGREETRRSDAELARALEREARDQRRIAELLADLRALRKRGYELAPPPKKTTTAPDVDGNARKRAEIQAIRANEVAFRRNAATALVAQGLDAQTAEREAKRLFEESVSYQPTG